MIDSLSQYQDVKERIKTATEKTGRLVDDVKLIVVSKTYEADLIRPILEAGHRCFGENRVQEAKSKWPALKLEYPDIKLHLIGPLQSNKVSEAMALFDVIQTLDRPKLVDALANEILKQQAKTRFLIQVNTGREPQKAGVLPAEFDAFAGIAKEKLSNQLIGLMCIPPFDEDPKPHFQKLKDLAIGSNLTLTSMGMSADYELAIAQGANFVRVGSAIFGERAGSHLVAR